jgi:predicted metal-dependent phosphoesterase TrpH
VKADSKKNGFLEVWDHNTQEALADFRKAAKAFNKRMNKSPETALKVLVAEGICTKSGKLTKRYR